MSESFASLFEESLQRTEMRPGEVITAEVVRVEHNFVVVNAGLKSEAYVPIDEFKNDRSEEHTSELQSHLNLVCRLLLEKKKTKPIHPQTAFPPHTYFPTHHSCLSLHN